MKFGLRSLSVTASVLLVIAGCATDKSFRIPRSTFDKEVTAIAVLPCENQIAASIDEHKQAYLAWVSSLKKNMNNGFNFVMVSGSSATEIDAEAKEWNDRFETTDRPFVARCLEIADSAMVASLSATNRFALTDPPQCAKVKKDVFIENRIVTRADTIDLSYDPARKKAIADTFIKRLPGDAVMNMSLQCAPAFQGKRASLSLKVIIMSKARDLYWEKYLVLVDIDKKTKLEEVLHSGQIEKAIVDAVKTFKR